MNVKKAKQWKYSWIIILLASLAGQVPAQVANNMTLLSNWDNNSLPSNSGVVYNDCWGYADGNGREYAILGSTQGTYIFDITVPTTPQMVTFQLGGSTNSIWRDYKTYQHYLYAVSDQGAGSSLQIFDLSGLPATVTKVYDSQALFSRAHNIFISENSGRLYVAGVVGVSGQNLMIFDIATNPVAPQQLANIPLTGIFMPMGYVHDIHCHNDTCYTFHGTNGMDIINFANLPSIQIIGRMTAYPDQGYCHSGWATSDNNYLVVADETHNMGLKVIDVNILPTPVHRATFRSQLEGPTYTNSIAHNPFINGNLVYVAYYHDGLQVYDISSKLAPTLVMGYDTHPQNVDYTGYDGAWGVYPFLPSGNIIVSDTKNGLFVLGPTVLPVELTEFEANLENGAVRLDWTTQTELNNASFTVERSANGADWEDLQSVEGAGTSQRIHRYRAVDAQPLEGTSWYRIRQTDFDGQQTWSQVKRIATAQAFGVKALYPVPATQDQSLQLDYSLEQEADLRLSIVDLVGRVAYEAVRYCPKGDGHWEIPLTGLAEGAYRMVVSGQDIQEIRPFVITH